MKTQSSRFGLSFAIFVLFSPLVSRLAGAPVITTQPASQIVTAGTAASLAVSATGLPPLSYQWRFDGGSLLGEMAPTLDIISADESQQGSYTVVVTDASGSVTSQVATLTIDQPGLPLTLGEPVESYVYSPAEHDLYRFAGAPGQRLYFDGLTNAGGLNAALFAPSGVQVFSVAVDQDNGPVTLAESGTYTMVVYGSGQATGDYGFQLLDAAAAPLLAAQTTVTGTLSPGTSATLWRLDGVPPGQALYFASGQSANATWYLYGQANQNLGGNSLNGDFSIASAPGGELILVVAGNDPNNPVNYSFEVLADTAPSEALVLGSQVSGALAMAGDQAVYTFSGTTGQRLYFDGLTNAGGISAALYSPSGLQIFNVGVDQDYGPATLVETGTFKLVVSGSGQSVGAYGFSLMDLASARSLPFQNIISGSIASPNQAIVYVFTGSAGQRVNVAEMSASGPGAIWTLFGPLNQTLASAGIAADLGVVTLPQLGSYALIVQGSASVPLSYQFEMTDASDTYVPASGFGLQTGVAPAGSSNTVTFAGPAGLSIYLDGMTDPSESLTATVAFSDGTVVLADPLANDAGPVTLPRSGTYTVTVQNPGASDENYSFRLLGLPGDAMPLTLGAPVYGSLANSFQTDVYSFSGSAGQRLYYNGLTNAGSLYAILYSPGGEVVINSAVDSDNGPLTLGQTGSYTLVVFGSGPAAGAYGFALYDVASAPVLGLDTNTSGTLNPGNGAGLWRIDGVAAGNALYYASLQSGNAFWNVYGPGNQPLGGNTLYGNFTLGAASGGELLLVLSGYDQNNPVNYSLTVYEDAAASGVAMGFGTNVAGALALPGDQAVYTFAGTNGQRLFFDGLTNAGNIYATLYAPGGNEIFNVGVDQDSSGPFTLSEAGTYQLVVAGTGGSAGAYAFQILDAAAAPALSLDSVVSGTLTPGSSSALWRVTPPVAGESLYFATLAGGNGAWYLYGAGNQNLGGNSLSGDFTINNPPDGELLLVVSGYTPSAPVDYSFEVFGDTTFNEPALALGTPVYGSLALPGDQAVYTLAAPAGQRLYFDGLTNAGDLSAALFAPGGAQVFGGAVDQDAGPFTLAESGTYTLVVSGGGQSTGAYGFRILDATAAPLIGLQTQVAGTLAPGNSAALWRLDGVPAGQALYFASAQPGNAYWYLYGQADQNLGGNSLNADFSVNPAPGGELLLVVSGYDPNNPVGYSFEAIADTAPTGGIVLGSLVSGGLASAGDQRVYTFSGTMGQRLYYDGLTNAGGLSATLYSPSGLEIFSGAVDTSFGPFTLLETGAFKLVVSGAGQDVGAFGFSLVDLASAPSLPFENTISGSIASPNQAIVYGFTGSAGQRVNLAEMSSSGSGAWWTFYGPLNQTLASANISASLGVVTLPQTGSYAVIVQGSASVPLSYQFEMTEVSDTYVPASGFGLQTGVAPAGASSTVAFNGPAGLSIYLDGMTDPGESLTATMTFSDGTVVLADPLSSDAGPVTLPRSGTYTVTVRNPGASDENYSFRLLGLPSDAMPLTLGAPVYGNLANPFQSDVYTFSGTAGQRLFYNGLTNAGSLYAILYSPGGETVLNPGVDGDTGPVTLGQTGTYTLVVYGIGPAAGAYGFALYDVAAAPVLALDTNTTGTLNPGNGAVFWRIAGVAAGQALYFASISGTGNGSWGVYGPGNQSLAGNNQLARDFRVGAATGGELLLVVAGYDQNNPVNYSFTVYEDEAAAGVAIGFGTNVAGSIALPGDQPVYTFTGAAGQRLFYSGLTNAGNITATVYGPAGNQILNTAADQNSAAPFTLSEAGIYQLVVSGYGQATGAYAFQILDAATAPALSLETVVSGTLTPGNSSAIWRVDSAVVGERLYFASLAGATAEWIVYGAGNQDLGFNNMGGDIVLNSAPAGELLLVVSGSSPSGPVAYSFEVFPGNHAPVLAAVPDQRVVLGNTVAFTNQATDAELHDGILTYSLDSGAPAGASIDPVTGIFNWTPSASQAPSTNVITARVTDNGIPALSDAQTFTVLVRGIPALSWGAPADIVYGALLGSAQLDASANVPGTFAYSPAAGTLLGAGTNQTLRVTFTPTDTNGYITVTGSAAITVHPATPAITWGNPADIIYGAALGAAQLDAAADVPGTFVYAPPAGTVLHAGANQTLRGTFSPTDTLNYTTASSSVSINVHQAIPVITWGNPADITYRTALGSAQLNASANVAGAFAYTPAAGAVLNAGANQSLRATFTPADTVDYTTASASASINVRQATPVITWGNPADITYGTALGAAQLNASANVAGTFAYTPAAGTTLNAGANQTLRATFTPTDTVDYTTSSASASINVRQATPVITWANPADITYGTALGAAQLSATANTAGTFAYAPAAGTVLNAGVNQALSVTFTPADTADYTTASATASLNVARAGQTITFAPIPDHEVGDTFALNATTTSGLTVAFALVAGPAELSGSTLTVTNAGLITISASQSGNTNYTVAAMVTQSFQGTNGIPPTLTISLSRGLLLLEWPNPSYNFILESSMALGRTSDWTAVTNAVAATTTNYSVTIETNGPAAFYRLRR
jgi:hypothetical protein